MRHRAGHRAGRASTLLLKAITRSGCCTQSGDTFNRRGCLTPSHDAFIDSNAGSATRALLLFQELLTPGFIG
jgi:hypothetical protein